MWRLVFSISSIVLSLSSAQAALVINERVVSSTTPVQPVSIVPTENHQALQQCLSRLQPVALRAGIRPENFSQYTANLVPDGSVLEKLNYQPEFSTPIWDYLSGLVDQERVDLGKARIQQHQALLQRISLHYGVPIEVIVAVWGVETNYGQISGSYPLLQALATLSCDGRRQSFFRGELFTTMRLLQRGDVKPEQLVGSWAGAFGQTQFMPSTYDELAVDFDGDGRRDLVGSTADALASTANFLNKRGWQTGQTWGFEITPPADFSIQGESRRNKKSLSYWMNQGLQRADGTELIQGAFSADSKAGLFAPAGEDGPLFLVFKNFDVLYSYNAAESYALAIAHLADRLQGKAVFTQAWPTEDAGTSRAERREIQQYLLQRGYAIGAIDGLIGDKTRHAIRQEQTRLGLAPTARAGQVFLNAIRRQK